MFKTNRFLSIIIKIIISVFAVIFLYNYFNKQNFSFDSIFQLNAWQWILLMVFTLINWTLEIAKWQFLASKVQKISYKEASKQSLISFSLSLLTPNRVGELGVKTLFFDKQNAKKIFSLSLIGTTTQMLTSLLFGLLALVFSALYFPDVITHLQEKISIRFSFFQWLILGLSFVFVLVTLWIYLKKKHTKLLLNNQVIWRKSFGFSILRYLVFGTQFMLIYTFLSIDFNPMLVYIAIALTYFISTLIPMLSFMDWALKGSVALYIFGLFYLDSTIAVISVGLMWILNFMLPFVVGIYLLWQWKMTQQE